MLQCIVGCMYRVMYCSVCLWLQYTDTSIPTTTFVESKLDTVMIKIDFVSYYHLPQIVPFPIAGHKYLPLRPESWTYMATVGC